MADWIKWIALFLQGNQSKIMVLAVMIVFVMPYEPFKGIRDRFPTLFGIAVAISLAVIILNSYELYKSWRLKKEEERKIKEKEDFEWQEFDELTPEMQFFVLNLYFSSEKVVYVRVSKNEILTLLVLKYIRTVGVPALDAGYQRACDVALTTAKLEYIRKYKDRSKDRWIKLKEEKIKEEIEDWRGRRSRFD